MQPLLTTTPVVVLRLSKPIPDGVLSHVQNGMHVVRAADRTWSCALCVLCVLCVLSSDLERRRGVYTFGHNTRGDVLEEVSDDGALVALKLKAKSLLELAGV
eukprot:1317517-Amorphochlora_amoeboformis.AAC.1